MHGPCGPDGVYPNVIERGNAHYFWLILYGLILEKMKVMFFMASV